MSATSADRYRWDILVPAHRYVFAFDHDQDEGAGGRLKEFNEPGDSPADRFKRYQALKAEHPVHGMIAWPNSILLRGPVTAVIDPGIVMQGPPLLLALERLGVAPEQVELVINTHGHSDHVEANVFFPGAQVVVHILESGVPPKDFLGVAGADEEGPTGRLLLQGDSGLIAPGLSFLRTPGHTEGSISLLVDTPDGLVAIAGDTVGPLPQYFEDMDLPAGFPGREQLLQSWRRLRELRPRVVIPGHNPPITLPG